MSNQRFNLLLGELENLDAYIVSFQESLVTVPMFSYPSDTYLNNGEVDWDRVMERMNGDFSAHLTDSNRGNNQVYIVLEKSGDAGKFLSYGNAHHDSGGRISMHYMYIKGGYEGLNKIVKTLIDCPKNVSGLVHRVFSWKNEKYPEPTQGLRRQPDIMEACYELYVKSPETGIIKIVI